MKNHLPFAPQCGPALMLAVYVAAPAVLWWLILSLP